jgi:hypothetical protein
MRGTIGAARVAGLQLAKASRSRAELDVTVVTSECGESSDPDGRVTLS